jgi:hypothetical protein
MPLLRIDAYRGRSKSEVAELLDAIHRAVVEAFEVPERDRYQLYQEHDPDHLIVQDTGLGLERSRRTIVISMTSRARAKPSASRHFTSCSRRSSRPVG